MIGAGGGIDGHGGGRERGCGRGDTLTTANSVDLDATLRKRELVDIGGRALEVERAGIGQPTVVLEAGGGCLLDSWDPIWPALTALTHVVRYNRAGLGASHKAPTPRTVLDVVTDL